MFPAQVVVWEGRITEESAMLMLRGFVTPGVQTADAFHCSKFFLQTNVNITVSIV
jgi:hypothetical protein